jgi:uncharacterized membrane protein
MILFRFLKLFGIDVPAHVAKLQARFEQRVEVAKGQVRQAAQTAAIVVAMSALALVAALSAVGLGLFALYSWVLVNYGQFYGLAAVSGVLILSAIILFVGAFLEARSWSVDDANLKHVTETQAATDRMPAPADVAASEETPYGAFHSPRPTHTGTSAADLVGRYPLSCRG